MSSSFRLRGLALSVAVLLAPADLAWGQMTTAGDSGGGQDPMAQHYELGHGLRLGHSGFTLGGYGELSFRDTRDTDDWRVALDSLSGILWWDGGGRWHFFSEVELDNAVQVQPGDTTTDRVRVISERLYLDYVWRDPLKLRLGKFLTPVGRWNLIHAAPLTWTTSRPLITEATFPTNTTGAMVYGVLPWTAGGIEYSIYASPGKELFPARGLDTFSEALGARLAATLLPHTQFGLSWVSFEQEDEPELRKHLFGADFGWSYRRFEMSGEFAYRTLAGQEETQDEQGHYAQLVAPLYRQLYAVARYEGFHRSGENRDLSLYLGGLTWRRTPALVFKGEYSRATDNQAGVPDGFFASFAVLF
ncbi:MAG: hypothetical protein ACT4QA_05280 [Panacagrimonas sp.]